MKKLLLMSVIALMLGATSAYAKCEGGVEFQGAVNGHTYCRSSTVMTWWAAFAWCEFQGRELATMEQLCPEWGGGRGLNSCPNMSADLGIQVWSTNPSDSSSAFSVGLTGFVNTAPHHLVRTALNYAICY